MHFTSILVAAAALLAPVSSNAIGRQSAAVELGRRAQLANCNATQTPILEKAIARAHDLATAAADAALNGDEARFERYFKTTDPEARKQVSDRFKAIAEEAKSSTSGKVQYSCGVEGATCRKGTLAYAIMGKATVVNCPAYYLVTEQTDSCDGKDQALVVIHELAHIGEVYSPAAGDYAYSYQNIMKLDSAKALKNADTLLYYANGVRLECEADDVEPYPKWFQDLIASGEFSKDA